MVVTVANPQKESSVSIRQVARLARCAMTRLRITTVGTLAIIFLDATEIRRLNKQFLQHDRPTDVLSFRYDGEPTGLPYLPSQQHVNRQARNRSQRASGQYVRSAGSRHRQVVGEIFIAPSQAQAYARMHNLSYQEELNRYVVHGLLHWMGEEDRTKQQQTRMRRLENRLLKQCQNT